MKFKDKGGRAVTIIATKIVGWKALDKKSTRVFTQDDTRDSFVVAASVDKVEAAYLEATKPVAPAVSIDGVEMEKMTKKKVSFRPVEPALLTESSGLSDDPKQCGCRNCSG